MNRMPARTLGILAISLATLSPMVRVPAGAAGNPSFECVARSTPVPRGPVRLVKDTVLAHTKGRTHVLTLRSPALQSTVAVDVLLPANYKAHAAGRYHVLYLLHGAGGSNVDWVDHGVQQLIDRHRRAAHLAPFITVMPDDGVEGFYTNWYGSDADAPSEGPPPAWATFEIHELIPFIDHRYRTLASRRGRAIAGLSMGGFGATSLAARHPGLYSVVGTFSGAVDTDYEYPFENLLLTGSSPIFTDATPNACIWGDPATEQVHWEAGDPTYLAGNLAHAHLFVASGNGHPGPYDDTSPSGEPATQAAGGLEMDIIAMNRAFVAALDASHIAHTDYFYGPGTHSWPYWMRDLRHFLPFLAHSWAHPLASPTDFNYRTEARRFHAWGWAFRVSHSAAEFTYLRSVSPRRLVASGSGTLHVLSARRYRPGSHWTATIHGQTRHLVASASGRLRFTVSLGAPRTAQQSSFPASGPPAGWATTTVALHPSG
jgi:diacylglycerol O-acyltransferase / trehalose O-mycolyltransferase